MLASYTDMQSPDAPTPEAPEVSAPTEPTAKPEAVTPISAPTIDAPDAPIASNKSAPQAAEELDPWEKVSVSFGGLFAIVASDVRFGAAGVGVEVNFEDLLGMDSSTDSYRFTGSWRFSDNRRHRADLSWIDLGRSGSLTTRQDVDVGGGTVIPAGSGIKTGFQMDLIRADYSYSFLQDDRIDFAGIFGFYVAPMEASLETTTGAGFQTKFNATAPLPLIGLRMDVAMTPKWYLRSNVSLFYVEYDGYTGSMSDIALAAEYRAWEHFSFGLGVDSFKLGIEHEGGSSVPGIDRQGKVDFAYTGVMLYLKGLW